MRRTPSCELSLVPRLGNDHPVPAEGFDEFAFLQETAAEAGLGVTVEPEDEA